MATAWALPRSWAAEIATAAEWAGWEVVWADSSVVLLANLVEAAGTGEVWEEDWVVSSAATAAMAVTAAAGWEVVWAGCWAVSEATRTAVTAAVGSASRCRAMAIRVETTEDTAEENGRTRDEARRSARSARLYEKLSNIEKGISI